MHTKLIYTLLFVISTMTVFGQGINFEKGTFKENLAKAKAENKLFFIDAYAVWCGPCKWMDANTFKDAKVGEYFDKNIVAMKLDVERGEGPHLKGLYAIEGLPGYLFMDGDGNIVGRASGSMPVDKFMGIVEKAYNSLKDPNNVGRMAAQLPMKWDDPIFLRSYLEKLAETGSGQNTDVLEQFLKIQTQIPMESKEMVELLYNHKKSIIFGSKALDIVMKHHKSEVWRQELRKDKRFWFQNINKSMAEQTTEYAILKRDSTIIDMTLAEVKRVGLPVQPGQRERLMTYFYKSCKMGDEFKLYFEPEIDRFVASLNIDELVAKRAITRKAQKANPTQKMRSFAERDAERLMHMAREYGAFASNDSEHQKVLKWGQLVGHLVPDRAKFLSFHGTTEYLYGDKNKALEIKREALKIAQEQKEKDDIQKDIEYMETGGLITL